MCQLALGDLLLYPYFFNFKLKGKSAKMVEVVSQCLGLSPFYCCPGPLPDLVEAFVCSPWMREIVKDKVYSWPPEHESLSAAEVQSALQLGHQLEHPWQRVFIQIIPKKGCAVYPLARNCSQSVGLLADVSFSQLLHYVATSNNKNLWKDAFKKYSEHGIAVQGKGGTQVGTECMSSVLREAVHRLYGCILIPLQENSDLQSATLNGPSCRPHSNILPAICALEGKHHMFVVLQSVGHNMQHCVSFSPAKLIGSEVRPLFVLYQLLEAARDTHDRGLHLGDVTLSHLFVDDALYLSLLPCIPDTLIEPESQPSQTKDVNNEAAWLNGEPITPQGAPDPDHPPVDSSINIPGICSTGRLHDYQQLLSSDDVYNLLKQVEGGGEQLESMLHCSLVHLTQLWVGHQITTLDYLLCLNFFAGRKFNVPNHHPIVPWVTDFSTRTSGWRDLTKTKFRLNKGDQQLDQTYQMAATHGQSKQTSIHQDMGDLEVPEWCSDTENFLSLHRSMLESERVSRRLHHWIDLNFGHKLSGGASVKAKNVCLQLVDHHTFLASGGVVQLFTTPHPPRLTSSPYLGRSPPKLIVTPLPETKTEKCDEQSEADSAPERQDEEMENFKALALSKKLSRSRTSLCEEKQAELPCIQLPHDYNPLVAMNQLEMQFNFVLKASRRIPKQLIKFKDNQQAVKQAAHLRRVRDMQAIGCMIVEMFSASKCRGLGKRASLRERYAHAQKLLAHDQNDMPRCARRALQIIFQMLSSQDTEHTSLPSKYDPVSSDGLPPPSPHQLLQPLINLVVFPSYFPKLYRFVCKMRQYSSLLCEAQGIHVDTHERKEYIQKVMANRVKMAARDLPDILPSLSLEGLDLILPFLTELFECPESAVSAAWYLTSILAQALGPEGANKHLLPPLVKLFEAENVTDKHLKLFHRSFLLQLIVWLGLEKFLSHFITPLIEGVGGYKDILGKSHQSPELMRKQSTSLRSVDISLGVEGVISPCEEDSHSSAAEITLRLHSDQDQSTDINPEEAEAEPEVFVFEGGEEEADSKSPDTPLQDTSDQLRSPMASETLSLDDVSLQEGVGSIPSHSPSPSAGEEEGEEKEEEVEREQEDNEEEEEIHSELDTPTPLASAYAASTTAYPTSPSSVTSGINIPRSGALPEISSTKSAREYSSSLPDFRLEKFKCVTNIDTEESKESLQKHHKEKESPYDRSRIELGHSMSDVCCESVLWLAGRLGPVLTARYVTRNLLRMLTLCYLPDSGALAPLPPDPDDLLSVTKKRIVGDSYSKKVLICLSEIACLYGEQVILLQYLCHICELVASCRRKLSATMEGGLLGAMALLQHLLPYLTDHTFMEYLQETLIRNAVYPVIRLLSSTKVNFPHGGAARGVLACRVIDCLFIMVRRVGREMSKSILMPTIIRFLTTFDKCHSSSLGQLTALNRSNEGVETEDSEKSSGPYQTSLVNEDSIKIKAIEELKEVLTPELAYLSYVPLCKFLGPSYMEVTLPNHDLLHSLCLQFDENNQADHAAVLTDDGLGLSSSGDEASGGGGHRKSVSSRGGTNVAVTGNRIDIKDGADGVFSPLTDLPPSTGFATTVDITKYTNTKMENTQRHLRGNWLAYWEHEIGRSEQDSRFNFKQIKLQTFVGHNNSVKSIQVLDNENSFISCSKDKTVKLWSLRSQGDGSSHVSPQWTYTGHKKSVFGVTLCESMRYAASCDSTVHVWDPFICATIKQLDSLRHSPVTVLTAMAAPSTQLVVATTDATLKFIDLRTCSYIHEFKVSVGGAGLVRCIDSSGDGHLVAVAHSSGVISVLDIRTGHLLSTWKPHEGEVLCMKWHRNSTFISSALDQTMSVWSTDDTKLKFTLRGPTEPVHLINLYEDEVITGTTANRIGVHTSISPTASFSSTRLRSDTFRGVLTTMAVLPLNRLMLLGADNGTIRLLC
ncbi:WD repeat-containing protein 81-like isoform X3 [Portunus trituberculatus]|uniref:WD repeat-containing protein 81-like isoform X3 n=1 Tax=Portunus trituberculatus TaxID=210409 RepID=UPI001E1CBE61|nr:WD repeat-containing protein 81-like isoform X3 [Portunus trituberculatus]